jgi:hypothetical protein
LRIFYGEISLDPNPSSRILTDTVASLGVASFKLNRPAQPKRQSAMVESGVRSTAEGCPDEGQSFQSAKVADWIRPSLRIPRQNLEATAAVFIGEGQGQQNVTIAARSLGASPLKGFHQNAKFCFFLETCLPPAKSGAGQRAEREDKGENDESLKQGDPHLRPQ